MENDVKVVCDEWENIKGKIDRKVDEINYTIEEFVNILNVLSTEGFIEGTGQSAVYNFKENIVSLKECVSYISQNIGKTIDSFTNDIEYIDHNQL